MLCVDTLYISVLAWYFSNVWPTEFGTQKPWYFPILPSTYLPSFLLRKFQRDPRTVSNSELAVEDIDAKNEPVSGTVPS